MKEELDRADWDEDKSNEGMTDERAKRIEHQSGGILKPKKDKNILLKPKQKEIAGWGLIATANPKTAKAASD